MGRNEWADRFVESVIRRTQWDAPPKSKGILLMVVVRPIINIILTTTLLAFHQDIFPGDHSLIIATVMGIMVECCLAGFVLFSLAKRTRNHLARDRVWMDSLIGYVESHGADTSGMRRVREEVPGRGWIAAAASAAAWVIILAMTVGVGVAIARGADPLPLSDWIIYEYIVILVQFIVTLGSTARFPWAHDDLQCRFTAELSEACRNFGLEVKPMEPCVKRNRWWVNTILFVVTLGLYTVMLLLLANYRTNRHIASQWRYESHLMISIVRFEGGIGIEGYGNNQPENGLLRLITNLL